MKLRVFVPKVPIQVLIQPFYECNAITMAGFTVWHSAGGPWLTHRRSQEGVGSAPPFPIKMTPMIKMRQKVYLFQVSVSFSIFAYNNTRVRQKLTINWQPGGPSIQFWQPIYMYNLGEIKGFCPKTCNVMPLSIHFYEYNAIARAGFTVWHSARCLALRWENIYLVFPICDTKMLPKSPKYQGPHAM